MQTFAVKMAADMPYERVSEDCKASPEPTSLILLIQINIKKVHQNFY